MDILKTYTYELEMLKLSDKPEIEIHAESEIARDTFLKRFLEDPNERYFIDKKTNRQYNKEYIYSLLLKGERNG